MEVNNRFVEEYAKEYFCDGERAKVVQEKKCRLLRSSRCLLYTSDAADE